MSHPHIVPLLAEHEGLLIYPYIEGCNLAQAFKKKPSQDDFIKMLEDILSALEYSHAQGVIHCDIKPSNILIRPSGRAVLSDFGFAKDKELMTITLDTMRMGTPQYMSPEQFQGQRDDPRNDIYSLGAVIYHWLYGEPPFGKKLLSFLLGQAEIQLKLKAHPLSAIAQRALAYRASERFQSVRAMQEALTHLALAKVEEER
ncbi:MAG: serine/threonine-protein kinase [Deinococcales bacterium]